MKLTVRHLQSGDFGNYRCISKNSLGETEGSIRLYGSFIWIVVKISIACFCMFMKRINENIFRNSHAVFVAQSN